MPPPAGNARQGTIFFTMVDKSTIFEVEDARVEVSRDVSALGRRTGASLNVRVHIIIDLISLGQGSNVTPQLFNISIQADDIVQQFKLEWRNPASGVAGDLGTLAREMTFSGWISGFEMYRPGVTGVSDFGTTDVSTDTTIGRADQLLHVTFAVVTDDDNIGNFTLTE